MRPPCASSNAPASPQYCSSAIPNIDWTCWRRERVCVMAPHAPRRRALAAQTWSCTSHMTQPKPQPILVAVPVKDEAERISDCLRALALQQDVRADGIVLVVNDTTDGTVDVVRALQPLLPVPVQIVEH